MHDLVVVLIDLERQPQDVVAEFTLRSSRAFGGPTSRPLRTGDRTPIDVSIDARLVVAILLGESDLGFKMLHQILSVEEGVLRHA
jgi:hypothetical protein